MSVDHSPVVVGVDGTSSGDRVLEAALDEARARRTGLEIITAWQWQGPFELDAGQETSQEARTRAEAMQTAVVERSLGRSGHGVSTSLRLIEGDPGRVLARAAQDAAILVIGHEPRNPVTRTILGSVSGYCVRHARCPVLVVPVNKPGERHGAPSPADMYRGRV